MIYQIISSDNVWTTGDFVRHWAPRLKGKFHLIPFQQLYEAERLPVGTFIFSDLERMADEQRELLAQVYEQLEPYCPPMRLLNHPLRACNRLELLSTLHKKGINSFRAFPAADVPSDLRFPVFLRIAKDHHGARSGLLQSWSELEEKLVEGLLSGWSLDQLMVSEFCDTSEAGEFTKYNAFRIGERIVARSVTYGAEWQRKESDTTPVWRDDVKWVYARSNPHAEQLMEVFLAANIEYGRIDYSVKDGRLEVWEINTAPMFSASIPDGLSEERRSIQQFVADQLASAFEEVASPVSEERVAIKLTWPGLSRLLGNCL